MRNLFNIEVGTYYDNESFIEFNRRLFATNWFKFIVIFQDFFVSRDTKSVPVKVLFIPEIISTLKISVGCFSDDMIGQLKVVWKKTCLNVYGHSFKNVFGILV